MKSAQEPAPSTILESITDGLVTLDRDWCYTYLNASAQRILARSRDDLLGKCVWDEYPRTVGTNVERELRRVAAEQVTGEFQGHDRAQKRWYDNRVFPMPDGGVAIYFHDITERKLAEVRLEKSEERFRRYFDLGLIGMAITAPTKGIIEVNEELCRILGYTREELLRKTWAELTHPDDLAVNLAFFEQAMSGQIDSYTLDKRFIRKDGQVIDATISVNCLRGEDGSVDCFVALLQDITQRKRTEEALREADRHKDEFLAMLGHELRNPLTPLRSMLEVLRLQTLDPQELAQAYAIMDRQIRYLCRLVDDLLDVSRITRGLIELRKDVVDLEQVVKASVQMAMPYVEARGHELTISLPARPIRLEGDETRLTQVFFNLLNNAAKYTEPGGRIWLSAERQTGEVVVRVRDNGTGMPAEFVPQVFDLFRRGEHAPHRSPGGLGLGLALVQRLVEMHGGDVEAHSEGLGKGSEFAVRLPALVPKVPETFPPPHAAFAPLAAAPIERLLVVDDDPDVAEAIVMLLSGLACEVRTVYSGAAAIATARAFRPQMILCDLGMPDLDGYEVARQLLHEPGLEQTLLVALTGYGQEEDRRRSLEAGFARHLVKPVSRPALEELVASAAKAQKSAACKTGKPERALQAESSFPS